MSSVTSLCSATPTMFPSFINMATIGSTHINKLTFRKNFHGDFCFIVFYNVHISVNGQSLFSIPSCNSILFCSLFYLFYSVFYFILSCILQTLYLYRAIPLSLSILSCNSIIFCILFLSILFCIL